MKHPDAIWITGVGVGTPLGWDFATVSENLIAGRSGVKKVDSFDVSQHPSQIAAVLDPVPCLRDGTRWSSPVIRVFIN